MQRKRVDKKLGRRLGTQIYKLRVQKGMTQFDLAEKAGIGISYIAKIEQGTRFPSIKTCARLAKSLKVDLWELFNFEKKLPQKTRPSREYLELEALLAELSPEELKLILGLAQKIQGIKT